MRIMHTLICSILLIATPSLMAQPPAWTYPNTYDEVMQLLENIESGELEKHYSLQDLAKINTYLITLAQQGNCDEESALDEDIDNLLYVRDSAFTQIHYFDHTSEYTIIPAVINNQTKPHILHCASMSNAWRKTKKFVKKHKKAIIIGAVVVVATAAVAVTVIAASSAAAAAAATAAAASASRQPAPVDPQTSYSAPTTTSKPNHLPPQTLQAVMTEQITTFKETLIQENIFEKPDISENTLTWEETGRIINPLFVRESLSQFHDHLYQNPQFAQELHGSHQDIDNPFPSPSLPIAMHQMKGLEAHTQGYYDQAVSDFSKVIQKNQENPMAYLYRSATYFEMRQYDKALEDFQAFTECPEIARKKIPDSEFTDSFSQSLLKGIHASGKGAILLLSDYICHPIHAATQTYQALSSLAKLTKADGASKISKALPPDVYLLIIAWNTLPPEKQGKLAGYALGKHGADILIPKAMDKIADTELEAPLRSLQAAAKILILETAAEIKDTTQLRELIDAGKANTYAAP